MDTVKLKLFSLLGFTIAKRLLRGKMFASLKFNGECSLITVNWVLPLSTESSQSSLNICFGSFAQSVYCKKQNKREDVLLI